LHLVGILFPHINGDARPKSHQIRFISLICFVNKLPPLSNLGDTDAVLAIYSEWKKRSFICENGSQTWVFSYFLLSFSGSNPLDPSKMFTTNLIYLC